MKVKLMIIVVALLGLAYLGMQLAGGGVEPQVAAADHRPQGSRGSDSSENRRDEEPFLSITMEDEILDDDEALLVASAELAEQVDIEPTAEAAEPQPEEAGSAHGPTLSVLPEPARSGVVGMLMRIEQHGRATGVECEHIDAPTEPGETYGLRGRGSPEALAIFLASLEADSSLGGATSLRVWAEDGRLLGFRAQLLVADEQER